MERPISYVYPAIFFYDDEGIAIEFPDFPGALSCAETTDEAVKNAQECLALHLYGMEQDGDEIPKSTDISKIKLEQGSVLVLVEAFMPSIRDREKKRYVKKTVSIPQWIDAEGQRAHVNFSQILQQGIIDKLDLKI